MKNKIKIKIGIILIILIIIPISLAITGTRSLTTEMQGYGYMCEDGKYQISISPVTGYTMEEILSGNWHFSSLEANAVDDCTIQTDDTKVRCAYIGSATRTLIFNVLNAPGIYNNIFSNDPAGDTASGLASVTVKENICSPDNDNDKYPNIPITNVCGCISNEIDCNDDDQTIHPGASEIIGNGIDEDCDGEDTPLPSTIIRDLPESVTQGVEFEVILNVQYTGKESSFVVDERFDTEYFDCGTSPSNGECHIVDNIGKVRWVITNPSSMQLKYYLIPKTTEPCYDFSDINGIYGTYQFQDRDEEKISGDYVIGDMSCVVCVPIGEEVCGNDVDEDCDGYICPVEIPEIAFSCSVKQTCNADEIDVMHLSDLINAHAELYTQLNYNQKICCYPKEILSNDCGNVLLKLSDTTNAHVEKNIQANYPNNVCLSTSIGILTCDYIPASDYTTAGYQVCTDNGYDTCLVTLSTEFVANTPDTNMHAADCITNPYITSLCCKLE